MSGKPGRLRRPSPASLRNNQGFDLSGSFETETPRESGRNLQAANEESVPDGQNGGSSALNGLVADKTTAESDTFSQKQDKSADKENGSLQEVDSAKVLGESRADARPGKGKIINDEGGQGTKPAKNASQSMAATMQEAPALEPDVFAKLAKTLEQHASRLGDEDKVREKDLRVKVVESLKEFKTDRSNLGCQLTAYKAVYKSRRQWTRVVREIGATVDLSVRTVFRVIEEYESSASPKKPDSVELADSNAICGDKLSPQEARERDVRLAVRSLLDDIPPQCKVEVLSEVLAEGAYQVWGRRDKFEITVAPKPSKFTFDGRKRKLEGTVKEVAA